MKNAFFHVVTTAVFAVDIWLKNRVEKQAETNGRASSDWLDFSYQETKPKGNRLFIPKRQHNRGLPMGIASEHQGKVAILSLLTTIGLLYAYFATIKAKGKLLRKLGLSLQLGGAFSNTYDRLTRRYVVDYFSFNVRGKLGQIVFNLADIAIIFGSLMVFLDSLKLSSNLESDTVSHTHR
ncbi:MAG: signal peptidase II [Lachnospiraceae bacterium]|jgi:signal peptidase II|nr:signal peptidase II [Lachnospiraceae bacterium]